MTVMLCAIHVGNNTKNIILMRGVKKNYNEQTSRLRKHT